MQAIVLVGGEGTRLRPLTSDVPKPALTLVDRPFLAYMIEWLAGHGVNEVVLACGFLPDVLREALGDGEHAGARIRYVAEPEPRGTAGAIRFAADELGEDLDDRFLALNGDVLTDLDLTALLRAHDERGARATIALHPVEDSSAYGLVRTGDGGEVLEFTEKTGEEVPGEVNAGMYVLERSVLDLIPPGENVSIERDVFPRWWERGCTGCDWTATGWTSGRRSATCSRPGTSSRGGSRRGSSRPRRGCWSLPTRPSLPTPRSARAPSSVRAAGSGRGAEVRDSVLLDGCAIGEGARVAGSILAPGVDGGARGGPRRRGGRPG